MTSHRRFIRQLTAAFLNGPWSAAALRSRGQQMIGEAPPWLDHLATAVIEHFGAYASPSPQLLATFLASHPACRQAWSDREKRPTIHRMPLTSPVSAPVPGFIDSRLPQLATGRDLADWLGITDGELDWFADCSARLPVEDRAPADRLMHQRSTGHGVRGQRNR